jgi:hypothetical protein
VSALPARTVRWAFSQVGVCVTPWRFCCLSLQLQSRFRSGPGAGFSDLCKFSCVSSACEESAGRCCAGSIARGADAIQILSRKRTRASGRSIRPLHAHALAFRLDQAAPATPPAGKLLGPHKAICPKHLKDNVCFSRIHA